MRHDPFIDEQNLMHGQKKAWSTRIQLKQTVAKLHDVWWNFKKWLNGASFVRWICNCFVCLQNCSDSRKVQRVSESFSHWCHKLVNSSVPIIDVNDRCGVLLSTFPFCCQKMFRYLKVGFNFLEQFLQTLQSCFYLLLRYPKWPWPTASWLYLANQVSIAANKDRPVHPSPANLQSVKTNWGSIATNKNYSTALGKTVPKSWNPPFIF